MNILNSKFIEIGSNSKYIIYVCSQETCKRRMECENDEFNEYIFDGLTNSEYQYDPIIIIIIIINIIIIIIINIIIIIFIIIYFKIKIIVK